MFDPSNKIAQIATKALLSWPIGFLTVVAVPRLLPQWWSGLAPGTRVVAFAGLCCLTVVPTQLAIQRYYDKRSKQTPIPGR